LVMFPSTPRSWNLFHSNKNSERYCHTYTYIDLQVKYPSFMSDVKKFGYSWKFPTNRQISNFVNIRPVGAELFHTYWRTDGRTGITRLIASFRSFGNERKKYSDTHDIFPRQPVYFSR
jgi:hypothetical protein